MNGQTHVLGALALGVLAARAAAPPHPLVFLAAAAIAAPLPDVDHPGSLYGRYIPLPTVTRVRGRVVPYVPQDRASFRPLGRRTPFGVLWHRQQTHSLFAAVFVSASATVIAMVSDSHVAFAVGLGALTGYLSHLALDAFNPTGMPLLWPFSRRRWRFPCRAFPVGGLGEALLSAALLAACVYFGRRLLAAG